MCSQSYLLVPEEGAQVVVSVGVEGRERRQPRVKRFHRPGDERGRSSGGGRHEETRRLHLGHLLGIGNEMELMILNQWAIGLDF